MQNKIFVSIPAWEDVTLKSTIHKLLGHANNPDDIVFGFGFNYNVEPDISWLPNKHYIIRDKVDYGDIQPGIIQIRNAIRRLMTDEQYYLSIDAHANFDDGWDTKLVDDLEMLHRISDRYVISKQLMPPEDRRNYYTKWSMLPDGSYIGTPTPDFDYQNTSNRMVADGYFLNHYVSGNFIFAKKNWIDGMEFPDYHGFPYEEPELSIATYCNGFDVVSPVGPKCPITAGHDPKYVFPYDERYWKFVGTDKDNPQHWEKIWVLDDSSMAEESRLLMRTGKNQYFSLENLPRSVKQFYDTISI